MSPLRRWVLITGLACWALAVVHAFLGFDTVFQAARSQALATERDRADYVFWAAWSDLFWIGFGMLSSAIGGVAIGWSLARPVPGDRARQGKIRNVLVENPTH
jgi:hypothetical protein